jgi:hypothetical protein
MSARKRGPGDCEWRARGSNVGQHRACEAEDEGEESVKGGFHGRGLGLNQLPLTLAGCNRLTCDIALAGRMISGNGVLPEISINHGRR